MEKCETPENIPFVIKNQLENFHYDESELLLFVAALFEESATLNLQYLWEREKNPDKRRSGLMPLADLLAKKLNLKPLT